MTGGDLTLELGLLNIQHQLESVLSHLVSLQPDPKVESTRLGVHQSVHENGSTPPVSRFRCWIGTHFLPLGP